MTFRDPVLFAWIAVPLLAGALASWRGRRWHVSVPSAAPFRGGPGVRRIARGALPAARLVGVALLVAAAARPIGDRVRLPVEGEGIDIALVVDVSGSMKAEDLAPGRTRLDVVKQVVKEFVRGRVGDRMGLVAFARYPVMACPFTLDAETVAAFVDRLEIVSLRDEDGTAIGAGLAQAVRRLKRSDAASKVVVLLTDGVNNVDDVTPEEATRLAAALGIRVYTIMAGHDRGLRSIFRGTEEADMRALVDIARATGGRFYRAQDAAALAGIYRDIDQLETSTFEEARFESFEDRFRPFALGGLTLLILASIADHSVLRRLP